MKTNNTIQELLNYMRDAGIEKCVWTAPSTRKLIAVCGGCSKLSKLGIVSRQMIKRFEDTDNISRKLTLCLDIIYFNLLDEIRKVQLINKAKAKDENCEWADLIDYPGYSVSTLGAVRGKKDSILAPTGNGCGYLHVTLINKNGKRVSKAIHRLVLKAFTWPERGPEYQCNHKDGEKYNNRLDNLEWVTQEQNIMHAQDHDLYNNARKVSGPILQLDVGGNIIATYKNISTAAKALGHVEKRKKIRSCLSRETEYYLGFKWRYAKDFPKTK